MLGDAPRHNVAEELAGISDQGLAALNQHIACFLGSDASKEECGPRGALLARLTELLDEVALIDDHQASAGRVQLRNSQGDDDEPNDHLRVASPRQMDILAHEKGAGSVSKARVWAMRHAVGWIPLSEFGRSRCYNNSAVMREIAEKCLKRKVAEYEAAGHSPEEADKLAQQQYIAMSFGRGGPMHKRDPYDSEAHTRRVTIHLSPEACRDMDEELARQPSFQHHMRRASGWVSLSTIAREVDPGHHSCTGVALLCRLYRCDALVATGLPPSEAEERVQHEYIAVDRLGQKGKTMIQLSPEAVRDVESLLCQVVGGPHPRRKPGWWTLSAAANALGHNRDYLASHVRKLRQDKLQEYRSQGVTPEEAESRAQDEYIAYRPGRRNGEGICTYTDLSPTAFHDLSLKVHVSAQWQSCAKAASVLHVRQSTIMRIAHDCRARRSECYIAQGAKPEEAEQRVQKEYVSIHTCGPVSVIHLSPEAYQDIRNVLRQSRLKSQITDEDSRSNPRGR